MPASVKEAIRDLYFRCTYPSNLGWKHSMVKERKEIEKALKGDLSVGFLTLSKNPYSWLLSMHRRPYHQYYGEKPKFEDFIKSPWKTLGRENSQASFANPVEMWNKKNAAYLGLNGENTINLTSEGLSEGPELVIERISKTFSIERKSANFVNYGSSTKGTDMKSDDYREYYLKEKWRNQLSDSEISAINERLDLSVMEALAYAVI